MMPGCRLCESQWLRFRFFPDCLVISTFLDIFIIDNSKLTMICQSGSTKGFGTVSDDKGKIRIYWAV